MAKQHMFTARSCCNQLISSNSSCDTIEKSILGICEIECVDAMFVAGYALVLMVFVRCLWNSLIGIWGVLRGCFTYLVEFASFVRKKVRWLKRETASGSKLLDFPCYTI